MKQISGFSKLSKEKKIDWLARTHFQDSEKAKEVLELYWNRNLKLQQLHDEFAENTISNFYLPFGIAPNFIINNQPYTIPMAIEESSVIAAASNAAKFWSDKGGFKAEVIDTKKVGQIHFTYTGDYEKLLTFFAEIKNTLLSSTREITKNMEKRGGGILSLELVNKTEALENYYQIHCHFNTLDAMGANFINSCLEQIASTFKNEIEQSEKFSAAEKEVEIIMSILSNYVPECRVKAEVSHPAHQLFSDEKKSLKFAEKFVQAVTIAKVEPYRAVTHNKGIMNGIDAVVLATGNDFRAVEAGIHAYASRNGSYASLSDAKIENGIFKFSLEIPLALGTVGGLTSLHPLVKLALEMLQQPSANELMQIVAVAGLAQNFAAIRSLTTTGIQEGHMKMHLMNILNQHEADTQERNLIIEHFKTQTVTHSAVIEKLTQIRNGN